MTGKAYFFVPTTVKGAYGGNSVLDGVSAMQNNDTIGITFTGS